MAAARRAAVISTATTSGPKSIAAASSGPSGASAWSGLSASRRAGASFKIAEKIEFVEPGSVESFRPLDLAFSHDGKTLYIADWSLGSWGNKTEKLGRVYAVTFAGADAVKTRPRGSDDDPVEAQIRQLDHPAFHERIRAQAALIRRGKSALVPVTAALESPKTDPVAKRHLLWVVERARRRDARGDLSSAGPVEIAGRRPAGPVGSCAGRAKCADRTRAARAAAARPRAFGSAASGDRAGADRAGRTAIPALLPVLADPRRLSRLFGPPGTQAH